MAFAGGIVPNQLRAQRERSSLTLRWSDGDSRTVQGSQPCNACRCSACIAARVKSTVAAPNQPIAISAVDMVGSYGLISNFQTGTPVAFFPGHTSGSLSHRDG